MDFETFVEYVESHIKEYLPPKEYEDAEVKVNSLQKMNGGYTGMTIVRNGGQLQASAVVNLDVMFELYKKTPRMKKIMPAIATIMTAKASIADLDLVDDYAAAREKLFIRVSSADKNRHKLADIPHRMIENLVITYHMKMTMSDGREGSMMLTNNLLEGYEVSPEQLHKDALANSQLILPARTTPLTSILGMPPADGNSGLTVLTNKGNVYGAAAMFYDGVLDGIADDLGGEILILPSSVHEVMVYKCDHVSQYADLEEIVKSINEEAVEESDRLTDTVYYYNSVTKVFELASKCAERLENFGDADELI